MYYLLICMASIAFLVIKVATVCFSGDAPTANALTRSNTAITSSTATMAPMKSIALGEVFLISLSSF